MNDLSNCSSVVDRFSQTLNELNDGPYSVETSTKVRGHFDEIRTNYGDDFRKTIADATVQSIRSGNLSHKNVREVISDMSCVTPGSEPIINSEIYRKILNESLKAIIHKPVEKKTQELATKIFAFASQTKREKEFVKTNDLISRTIRLGYNDRWFADVTPKSVSFILSFTPFCNPEQAWKKGQKLTETWIQQNRPLTKEDLINLNDTVRNYYSDDYERGCFRKKNMFPGFECSQTYFYPEDIDPAVDEYVTWLNSQLYSEEANPILTSAKAHQWLISIHPFSDANGRTTRLVSDFVLKKKGLPPIDYKQDPMLAVFRSHNNDCNGSSRAARIVCNALASTLGINTE